MSNLNFLLERYQEHPAVLQLVQSLSATNTRIELHGLVGAQESFVVAASTKALGARLHLIVAESKEDAAYFHDDLQGMLPEASVFFFPDSFKRPAFFDDLHSVQVLQRAETVNKITSAASPAGAKVLLTYPEALFERVVSPEALSETRITIAKGERLDLDFVMHVLVEYGFERTDFVYEPGQFSLRGGIVDLFSYGNDLPYRIELFDDEVDSLRSFDPLTQLSVAEHPAISIVPNLNTRFRQDQKTSLFQVLPENTVIWMRDLQFVLDRLQYCFEKAQLFADKISSLDSQEIRELFRDRAFVYPGDALADMAGHSIVFLSKQNPTNGAG